MRLLGWRALPHKSLSRAVARIEYTNDPLASSVLSQAARAAAAHLIKRLPPSLAGLYDLGPLNQLHGPETNREDQLQAGKPKIIPSLDRAPSVGWQPSTRPCPTSRLPR